MQAKVLRMPFHTYTLQRLVAALMPVGYWQHAPYSGPTEELPITTADGVTLAATLLPRGRPDLLIICHGFAASQRCLAIVWLAEALAEAWDVLTFDWRGFGQSSGLASMGGAELHDLAAVVAFAHARGYRRIGVIGESMGGLITLAALGMAAGNALPDSPLRYVGRAATLGAPADYALTVWPRPFLARHVAPLPWIRPVAPLLGFRLGPLDPACALDLVSQIRLPLLLIQGDTDRVVLPRCAELLHAHAANATLRVYPGVGHGVGAMRLQVPELLLEDLQQFFADM